MHLPQSVSITRTHVRSLSILCVPRGTLVQRMRCTHLLFLTEHLCNAHALHSFRKWPAN
jgi:hypothetical protein